MSDFANDTNVPINDLISRQELLEHLESCLQNGRPLSNLYDLSEIVRYVKSMPTIDVVEVVRCKDCKYRYKMACHNVEFYECSHIGLTSESGKITHVGVDDDYFCADGERRE